MRSVLFIIAFLFSFVLQAQNKAVKPDKEEVQVFKKVEVDGGYQKGRNALLRYFQIHMRYPEEARKQNIGGTVTVKFIVTKLGTISEAEAISGPQLLRAEAVRLINASGEWTPATQCGRLVKSFKTEEVVFVL